MTNGTPANRMHTQPIPFYKELNMSTHEILSAKACKEEVEAFYQTLSTYLTQKNIVCSNSAVFPKNIPYVFVADTESSGFIPKIIDLATTAAKPAQVLEIAVNVVCTKTKEVVDSFHSYAQHNPNDFCWEQEAETVHKLSIASLSDKPKLQDAMKALEDWALKYTIAEERWGKTYNRMYMCSHNPVFDQPMLETSLDYARAQGQYKGEISLHYRCPDAFTIGLLYGFENSKAQQKAAGMDSSRTHSAQADTNVTTAMFLKALRDMN